MTIEIESNKKFFMCPECRNHKDLINDYIRGEIICNRCGIVIKERCIDHGPEWRSFNSSEEVKKRRVGLPSTYTIHDKGLSTMIDHHNKDIYGRKVPNKTNTKFHRLRKWHYRTRIEGTVAKNLSKAMMVLDRLSSQLEIPRRIKETAAVIYRKALDLDIIKGRSIEAMTAASLYIACRLRKLPVTREELVQYSRISKKKLFKSYMYLVQILGIQIPVLNAKDFIPRFCTDLELSARVLNRAYEFIDLANKKRIITGKDPKSIAAAVIYIAGILEGNRRSQAIIAETAQVTDVTIRARYKELIKKLNIPFES